MKKIIAFFVILSMVLTMSSCSVPIIRDLVGSENSLGKTNNTAVTIASAMTEFLAAKKKSDLVLYGVDMVLNSDSNGVVLLYYSATLPEVAEYSDIYIAEVDSKTGHVERFSKANYSDDGVTPYQVVKEKRAIHVDSLPIDSDAAIANGVKVFSANADFYYDYIEVSLSASDEIECYHIRFISMLNDMVYSCTVDAVNGNVLESSAEVL